MKNHNRLQSASEFMFTYGWAILILAILLSLFYFFVVAQSAVLPTECTFASSITCRNIAIGSNMLSSVMVVLLTNSQKYSVIDPSITLNATGVGSVKGSCIPSVVLQGSSIICSVDLPLRLNTGTQLKGSVYINEDVCTNIASSENCQNTAAETYIGNFQSHVIPMLSPTTYSVSLSTTQLSLPADGIQNKITANVKLLGYPLSGATVEFTETPTFPQLSPVYVNTDANGNATTEISSKKAGSVTVNAIFAGISDSIILNFVTPAYVKFEINQANTGYPILSIDSVAYSDLPITLPLVPGSQHSYSFESTIPDTSSERYVYASASGCGISAESGTFAASNCTATGDYNVQYYLTAYSAEPSEGTVSPAGSWYTSGTKVTETAAALSGYEFTGWSGSGSGSYSGLQNPLTITLNNPITEAASFATALSASISPSSAIIDNGQQLQFTASASGGVSPYSYQWYSGSSSTCSSDTTISGATSSTYTASPSSSTYYCVKVTDSASGSYYSNAAYVTVNPALTLSVSPSSAVAMDQGQQITVSATAGGGSGSYSYAWSVVSGTSCPGFTSSSSPSFTYTPSGTTSSCKFTATVTDTGTTPTHATASGTTAQITVNPAPSLSSLTTSPTSGTSGQTETITGTISNGVSPYSVTAFSGSVEGSLPTSDCSVSSSTVTCTTTLPSVSSTTTDTYTITVKDSAGESASNTGSVAVSSPTQPVTLTETGLPSGDSWSVTLGSSTLSATSPSSIVFYENPGTYSYSVYQSYDSSSGEYYNPSPASGTITVSSNPVSQPISFTGQYSLYVGSSLPYFSDAVSPAGTTYYAPGTGVTINATEPYQYINDFFDIYWYGYGTGSYTCSNPPGGCPHSSYTYNSLHNVYLYSYAEPITIDGNIGEYPYVRYSNYFLLSSSTNLEGSEWIGGCTTAWTVYIYADAAHTQLLAGPLDGCMNNYLNPWFADSASTYYYTAEATYSGCPNSPEPSQSGSFTLPASSGDSVTITLVCNYSPTTTTSTTTIYNGGGGGGGGGSTYSASCGQSSSSPDQTAYEWTCTSSDSTVQCGEPECGTGPNLCYSISQGCFAPSSESTYNDDGGAGWPSGTYSYFTTSGNPCYSGSGENSYNLEVFSCSTHQPVSIDSDDGGGPECTNVAYNNC